LRLQAFVCPSFRSGLQQPQQQPTFNHQPALNNQQTCPDLTAAAAAAAMVAAAAVVVDILTGTIAMAAATLTTTPHTGMMFWREPAHFLSLFIVSAALCA
jgi:hypothetical protein